MVMAVVVSECSDCGLIQLLRLGERLHPVLSCPVLSCPAPFYSVASRDLSFFGFRPL